MAAKETKELVSFVVAVVKAGAEVMADGKVGISDAFTILKALEQAPQAFSGLTAVPAEFSAWSDADKAMVFAEIEKLDLASDTVEQWAERVLKTAVTLGQLVADYAKALKA